MDWLVIIINVLPLAVMAAAFVFFMNRLPIGRKLSRYQEESLVEMRKQSAALERIAAAAEKRD